MESKIYSHCIEGISQGERRFIKPRKKELTRTFFKWYFIRTKYTIWSLVCFYKLI